MSHMNRSLTAYFNQLGMKYPISFGIRWWPNINRFGDYHSPHIHPWCYLSGTYYIQVPEAEIDQESHEELKPACISYYDPRSGMNADMFPRASRAAPVYTARPGARGTTDLAISGLPFRAPKPVDTQEICASVSVSTCNGRTGTRS